MVDLAFKLTEDIDLSQPIRATLIADTPIALLEYLQQLEQMLEDIPVAFLLFTDIGFVEK